MTAIHFVSCGTNPFRPKPIAPCTYGRGVQLSQSLLATRKEALPGAPPVHIQSTWPNPVDDNNGYRRRVFFAIHGMRLLYQGNG